MGTPLANDFTFYERSVDEAREGAILSSLNIQNIQCLLSMAAMEKLNIEDDPTNPALTSLRRAKLDGEIGAYRSLIINSNDASTEKFEIAKEAAALESQKSQYLNAYQAFNKAVKTTPVSESKLP